ncbi:tRNA (mo5U34)-methyltransferase [Limihaloglobus sulfuriphilus]|uniref:tRNA (Mo5U34)-methyltransferase n=1 Tax=Limihaloglobus sulfuriphilus TaxID=1851148 RepID=A0A1Q2MDF4_9BACT|nr:tRNA 5-methoxyuridine(34)/uridine 5-oxyacetic acid(34) synthase CmoB [Limihaloglobus sulfuriphilus]AQQ70674.1 tRNA (mo5U34)-methyltransferase [Limihaloglobus sulfuriphilus]
MNNIPIDYSPFLEHCRSNGLAEFADFAESKLPQVREVFVHGDLEAWQAAIDALPQISPSVIDLTAAAVRIGAAGDCDESARKELREKLMRLHPWRKGPFDVFGVYVDTEWRSDWKWQRLCESISPLKGRRVLDVGCGSGYHCLRMLGEGAAAVVGIDPFLLFVMQFQALNRYIKTDAATVLPFRLEDMPDSMESFDTVFSMGVLYHRREPKEHIRHLRRLLSSRGELVLETLVLQAAGRDCLVPKGRYARMRNVWNIPTVDLLSDWLTDCGFSDIKLVDICRTTTDEQRSTDWMRFESLDKCLDPRDITKTVEGRPAPVRAVLTAKKPEKE